jgi:hypothetical protein
LLISQPQISRNHRTVTWSSQVSFDDEGSARQLTYELPAEYGDLLTRRSDAALAALLVPAMRRGETVNLAGAVTDEFFQQVRTDYSHVLARQLAGLRPVTIEAAELCPPEFPASGVATGFSAGIDSFCVLADHYLEDIPTRLRVSHLLFNDVGSHGRGGQRLFRQRFERIAPVAAEFGLPIVPVRSNLDGFYTESFQRTHTLRNASVALLLQGGIGRFLYASAFPYSVVEVQPTYDMAYSDPVSLPLLSTTAIRLLSAGSNYTRVEKTMRVSEVPKSHDHLDVCVDPDARDRNCSKCWKCLRTLLTLEIGGVLHLYRHSFDLSLYSAHRERYMATVLTSKDVLLREIVTFAKKRGFSWPTSARLLMPLAVLAPTTERVAQGVWRKLPENIRARGRPHLR